MHDAKSPEEIAEWHRWFGVECNNRAWALAESRMRTAADTDEMIAAAHAAAWHWSAVGTELNRVRAAMLLAHVLALAGEADRARRHAKGAYDYITSHESQPWEVAFAHAVLANAAAAAGDSSAHAKHYADARRIGTSLPDEERAVFERTFRVIPSPA